MAVKVASASCIVCWCHVILPIRSTVTRGSPADVSDKPFGAGADQQVHFDRGLLYEGEPYQGMPPMTNSSNAM